MESFCLTCFFFFCRSLPVCPRFFLSHAPSLIYTLCCLQPPSEYIALVQSRVFTIKLLAAGNEWHSAKVMLPIVDMLNTNVKEALNVECQTNTQSTHFECSTTRPVEKGVQLFGAYGRRQLPNGMLLMNYGVTFEQNDNDFIHLDVLSMIRLAEDPDAISTQSRRNILSVLSIQDVDHFELTKNIFPEPLLVLFRVYKFDEDLFLKYYSDEAEGRKKLFKYLQTPFVTDAEKWDPEESYISSELLVVKQILELVEGELAEYSTSLEEDKVLLENIGSSEHTLYHILNVRMGEKRVLKHWASQMKAILNKFGDGGASGKTSKAGGSSSSEGDRDDDDDDDDIDFDSEEDDQVDHDEL